VSAATLEGLLRAARVRRAAETALAGGPLGVLAAALAGRWLGTPAAALALAAGLLAVAALAARRARALDARWLARQLDARRADMEDSAGLLFAAPETLSGLQRLQRARLQRRLDTVPSPDLRPAWSTRALAAGAASLVLAAGALGWPERPSPTPHGAAAGAGGGPPATHTRLVERQLRVLPPAYTGLPAREGPALDAKAPQGTRLEWRLRFEPQPRGVELVFHDGRRTALRREGEAWRAEHLLDRSVLYRLEPGGAPPLEGQALHRLEATPDQPPQLQVLAPEQTLSLLTPGQRSWSLTFEGSDDYGLASDATLRLTLAQGSGENIAFREKVLSVRGTGSAVRKRFAHRVDLSALGLAVGDDLVAQLLVRDNRAPQAQAARSPSLILRWPAEASAEATGLEGLVKKVMPAYFRSQRQIIIDSEALLKQKPRLEGARFLERSDEIGTDQRILRMRYGQFLGEETSGAPQPPARDGEAGGRGSGEAHAHEAGAPDAHDAHATAPPPAPTFGEEGDVLEQYGHTHDHAEAATLFDPETRALLKAALDQMWQSELALRQGQPERALPHAYRALEHIKKVQQASRVYLARLGPELPPVDESRRLSGDRTGLGRRGVPRAAATAPDATLAAVWRALDAPPPAPGGGAPPVDAAALEQWLRENEARTPDPLGVAAVLEALRRDPACASCRGQLRSLLWPLLPRPAAGVSRRDAGDAAGGRYLDALREGASP
jgi:hypothetical protein